MFTPLSSSAALAIESAVAAALAEGAALATSAAPTSPREERIVCEQLHRLVPTLADALDRDLSGSGTSVAVEGVFCHQKPIVKFGAPRGVELGDLLLVVQIGLGELKANNALLLQYKKNSCRAKLDEADPQCRLYREWPRFRYVHGASNRARMVTQPIPHDGAQYAFANGCSACGSFEHNAVFTAASPESSGATRRLSTTIVDAVRGRTGRQFARRDLAQKGIDWDRIIWDLIDSALGATFPRKPTPATPIPRSRYASWPTTALATASLASVGKLGGGPGGGFTHGDWLAPTDAPPERGYGVLFVEVNVDGDEDGVQR